MLHSHLAGRKLRLRQIRDGKELAPLIEDNNYDFNFQSEREITNRTILPGDVLITECEYDTSNRDFLTLGGESTREEMCLAFVKVYPLPKSRYCISYPTFGTSLMSLGLPYTYGEYKPEVTEMEVYRDIWRKYPTMNWTESESLQYQVVQRYGDQVEICYANAGVFLYKVSHAYTGLRI